MKKVGVIGARGNMGSRYCAILKHLGIEHTITDIWPYHEPVEDCDGLIIATPTDSHVTMINRYAYLGKPILVEKPLAASEILLKNALSHSIPIRMINQYEYFVNPLHRGWTYYNYYNSGGDTLLWDCINIIGLAEGKFEVSNDSPTWQCQINGTVIPREKMDEAYVWNIKSWVEGDHDNREYILKAHRKIWDIEDKKRRALVD